MIGQVNKLKSNMLYSIEDTPSWYITLLLGFQHYLIAAGSTICLPIVLMPAMCMQIATDPDMGNIISTYLFIGGIVTFLQSTFGTRLPIVQGGSFAFIVPALAILSSDKWKCPEDIADLSQANQTLQWQSRMREVQGGIIMAGIFQTILGACGIFGVIMSYITPLSLASTMTVIGICLFEAGSQLSAKSWPVSIVTMLLIIIFSQYLRDFKVPIPFTKSQESKELLRYPVFQIFPILLSMALVWATCVILTISELIPYHNGARTDTNMEIFRNADVFRVPYPFQWGIPNFTSGASVGFLSAILVGIVESLGEYKAISRIVNSPPPPVHSTSRGVFIEGLGCILCGIFGTGNGTTSYSGNTGAMSVTRIGSRRVVQTAGVLMFLFSLCGKVGAFFVSIPDAIIGGVLCVTFGLIIGVGISNLHSVDVTSSRNMLIYGFSVYLGLAISKWAESNRTSIDFGHPELNFIIRILLSTGMFISALVSVFLDNTIPNSLINICEEQKPFTEETHLEFDELSDQLPSTYDLPFGMTWIRRSQFVSNVPISPTFRGFSSISNKAKIWTISTSIILFVAYAFLILSL